MTTCKNHITDSVVVHTESSCPLCWAEQKIHELEQEAGGLQEEVSDLEEEIKEMQKKIGEI